LLERIRTAVLRGRHHSGVPVGVIDVGSNTVRLLVAEHGSTLVTEREMLHLGGDVERHGRIPAAKLHEVAAVVERFADDARDAGVEALEVLIASPGRQAENGTELLAVAESAARFPARILSSAEEGQLAFVGAVAAAGVPPRRTVAVVDVGGGSAQVVVGSRKTGPVWTRSIDLGSQRLTSRLLSVDPPGPDAVEAARAEVERYLTGFDPPAPRATLAVGGSARAVKRIAGSRITAGELEDVIALLATTPADEVSRRSGVGAERARTLTAGAVILSCLQRRLGTSLRVVRGGLREGALLALDAERAARAA
jgi:exopolyphosphatase/pppGpp-phosphohydrolase